MKIGNLFARLSVVKKKIHFCQFYAAHFFTIVIGFHFIPDTISLQRTTSKNFENGKFVI